VKDQDQTTDPLISEFRELKQRVSTLEEAVKQISKGERSASLSGHERQGEQQLPDVLRGDKRNNEKSTDESDQGLNHILSFAAVGLYTRKPYGDYGVTFICGGITRLLGHEPQDFIEDSSFWSSRIHPNDSPRVFAELRKLFEQDRLVHEYRFRTKNGEYRWLRDEMCLIHCKDSNPLQIAGFLIDITDRKLVEEELRKSEHRLELALKCADLGLWDHNLRTGETNINRRRAEMVGYSPEELEPLISSWVRLVHPDDWGRVWEAYNVHLEGRAPVYESEHRLRHKLGHYIWILARGKIVEWDKDGKPARMVGTSLEITDRKRAEEAIRESEEKYRSLFADSIDGMCITDSDGTLIDANVSFLRLLGYDRDEMVGQSIVNMHVLDSENWNLCKSRLDEAGSVRDCLLRLRKKSGTESDCLITATVRRAADGSILGYRGIFRDVTKQKTLEKQLAQAQKMEAVGTLSGGIAHDFNNILTIIQGFTELLLAEKSEDDRKGTDLWKIWQAARNGADLVQRILTFSRKREINPIPFNLNHEIEQVEMLLSRTIPKMIEIELLLSEGLDRVNGDPTEVEHILMNLAVNAKDAMPEGGKLTIETKNVTIDQEYCSMHPGAKPGSYALLSVSDTGHGMDKETLNHIFEPFYTTKGVGQGTGLGLATVYGVVKQHDGYITCDSEPGVGTTFKVYLPVTKAERESQSSIGKLVLPRGTETVLLVDDEEMIRHLGRDILEPYGYTVLTACNGKEALNIYEEEINRISLVILDLLMPEMGGKQCFKELLRIDPQVKVLISTGYTSPGTPRQVLDLGAMGSIRKPYDIRQMLQAVRDALDQS